MFIGDVNKKKEKAFIYFTLYDVYVIKLCIFLV